MLTRKYNSANSYVSRLLALPLCVFVLFACSSKDTNDLKPTSAKEEIQVVTNNNNSATPLTESTPAENPNLVEQDNDNMIFEKVEVEAQFPGGVEAWRRFLERNLNAQVPSDEGAPEGTYTVVAKFLVDRMGNVSDVRTSTNHGYGMEEEVKRAIQGGPKWTPAINNGKLVNAYRYQPITFVVANQ